MAEDEKGFVIKDKRTFSPDSGEPRTEDVEADKEESKKEEVAQDAPTGESDRAEQAQGPLPEVDFATFVISLSSSAILHFGEIRDPSTGKKSENLPMAKHTIDILGMLEEKTQGNLTNEESELLKNILYDLRMRYVSKTT